MQHAENGRKNTRSMQIRGTETTRVKHGLAWPGLAMPGLAKRAKSTPRKKNLNQKQLASSRHATQPKQMRWKKARPSVQNTHHGRKHPIKPNSRHRDDRSQAWLGLAGRSHVVGAKSTSRRKKTRSNTTRVTYTFHAA